VTLPSFVVLEQELSLERPASVWTECNGVVRKTYILLLTVEAEGITEDVVNIFS